MVEPSVSVAVAVNACDCPAAIVTEIGFTVIDTIVAGVTVTFAVPETEPRVAVTAALPLIRPVTLPEAFTATMPVADEDHVTVVERSCVLPSL